MKTVIPKDFLDRIDFGKVAKYAAYLLLCLILQNIIFTQLRLFDVCPLVLPAVAVAMGMFEGAVWGPLFSLLLGIFADMAFVENTIFFTLVFPAVSFAAAFVANFFINRRFFAFMGVALVSLLITGTLQMLKTLAGDAWSTDMLTVVVLQTLVSLPVAALAYPLPAKWSRE